VSIPGLTNPSGGAESTFATQFSREAPQIEARKLQLMDTASGFAKQPVTIPGQTVSPFEQLQQEAFTRTQQGLGRFQPYLNQATQNLLASTTAYDPTTAYQQYMNPYQKEVISGIESQFDKMANQANLQASQSGAFGSEREGIQRAELGRQRAETIGQAQAQNYQQAQQQAQAQFSDQMSRLQQSAQGLGALGAQQQALQQGDIASAMSAGSVQQQQAQQIADAQYRQKLQQLYEPYQRLGFVSDIYQGMPSSGMSTTMGTSPMVNPLAQAVGTGITGLAGYQALKGN
tara:strand:- start:1491 stop:2354 length:864 start_codon:yes stop_codon:yes gene_type:complete